MRSIVTVTEAATDNDLTTLERVKDDLGITDSSKDAKLRTVITEASSRIAARLGYGLALETVKQVFRPDRCGERVTALFLDRVPVTTISSVKIDGETIDVAEYEVDTTNGMLYRINAAGVVCHWCPTTSIEVNYAGGSALPGDSPVTLPPAIEAATVALVRGLWGARGRDPMVRSVDVPDLMSEQYWVGSPGEAGALPPDVESLLADFVRPVL